MSLLVLRCVNCLVLVCLFFHLQMHAGEPERLSSTPSPYLASFFRSEKTLLLEENLQGGKQLKLDDGTTWEVAPQDIEKVKTWVLPLPLTFKKSGRKDYPYYLVNKRLKMQVLVRPLAASDHQQPQVPASSVKPTDLLPSTPQPVQTPDPGATQPSNPEPTRPSNPDSIPPSSSAPIQ